MISAEKNNYCCNNLNYLNVTGRKTTMGLKSNFLHDYEFLKQQYWPFNFSAKEIKPGASGPYISKRISKKIKRERLDLPLTQSSELSRVSMGSSKHSPSNHSKPIVSKPSSSHNGKLETFVLKVRNWPFKVSLMTRFHRAMAIATSLEMGIIVLLRTVSTER